MNIFNRLVMLLLSLILFAFGTITFLLLTGLIVPGNSYLRAILALYAAWRAVALLRGATTSIAVLIALVLALVGLVMVILEVAPVGRLFRRREAKQYVVRQDAMGQVTLARSMVADLAQHVAGTTPGVMQGEAEVKDSADGLRLAMRVSLAWDADAPEVGRLLQERVKDAVQTQLGLQVAEVRVTAQAAPVVKEQRGRVARVA